MLSPDKLALFDQLVREHGIESRGGPRVRPRAGDTRALSSAQQRLWFLERLTPGQPIHTIPAAVRIRGPLDERLLARGLDEIVARHAILRTTFHDVDGEPVCAVAPHATWPLDVVDLHHLPADAREPEACRLVAAEARRAFDLTRGPLVGGLLIRLDPTDHALALPIHHIVCDGTSVGVIIREVTTLYQAFAAGRPSPLPPLSIQYSDYAAWEAEHLRGDRAQTLVTYWRRQLAGAPDRLDLPFDRAKPPGTGIGIGIGRSGRHTLVLSPPMGEALHGVARDHGVSMFMTLLAALQLLLARYSGQHDIVVGTPVTNRQRPELDGVIGIFINTLVLRTNLAGDPTVRELLWRVRDVAVGAYAHQDLPFEKLVEELKPERHLHRSPLFQVLLNYQRDERRVHATASAKDGGITVSPLAADTGVTRFDLTVQITEREDGLTTLIDYDADRFEPSTIARMGEHFRRLLDAMITDPSRRVSTLPMLSDDERRLMLVEWNATARPLPSPSSLSGLIDARAALAPGRVAIVHDQHETTYGELTRAATRIAAQLQRLGIGVGSRVAIGAERSPLLIAGLLGILKAGAAYVPLDPSHPAERNSQILADARVDVLLTDRGLLDLMRASVPARDLESLADTATPGATFPAIQAGDLAYVIYTSGSTGRPKGVAVTHGAVINVLTALRDDVGVTESDRLLAVTTIAFDIAALEILMPLLTGATVVLASREVTRDPALLAREIVSTRASVMQATPSTWRMLIDAGWHGAADLTCLCGGEACPPSLAATLVRNTRAVWNVYGPTETTIWSTAHRVSPDHAGSVGDRVPIGRPLANTELYIFDAHMQPVPIGVPGELFIGGAGVAWGYLHRPALTAEKFVPHLFAERRGARLYRTGDLAKYEADGRVQCLGRLDGQLKIRGFRVEPAEIESVLASHPGLQTAVVVAREDSTGGARLAAYVTSTDDDAPPSPSHLREFLARRLPDYMVPSDIVMLTTMPLTPNGKIDRAALPAPSAIADADALHAATPPRTAIEQTLAAIWAEALHVASPGLESHFFHLGGHSLTATRLVARVRDALDVDVPVRTIFEHPTLEAFAREVARLQTSCDTPAPPMGVDTVARGDKGALLAHRMAPLDAELSVFPLSAAQRRLWLLDQLDPGSATYHITLAVHLRGRLDTRVLEHVINHIVQRHETLRTAIVEIDGEPSQVIRRTLTIALDEIDLRAFDPATHDARVTQLARESATAPFALAQAPLFRARCVRLGDESLVLLLTMHHLIGDHASLHVFCRELMIGCRDASGGRTIALPPPPAQYVDFVDWQRTQLDERAIASHLAYWKTRLDGAPPLLDLPTDRPRPAMLSFRGARHAFTIPPRLTAALRAWGERHGASLFMTLLAAFQMLLARYTSDDDIVVGSPVGGRPRPEFEGAIGPFVNTLVFRADLSGDPTMSDVLRRVRESALDAYAHQELPFERVVEALSPARHLNRSPIFQVMFAFYGAIADGISPAAADANVFTWQPVALDPGIAKFDLTLSIEAGSGALAASFEFNTDLFDPPTIARIADCLTRVLEAAAVNPEQRMWSVDLASTAAAPAVAPSIAAANPNTTAHALFEAQAATTPDAIAVASAIGDVRYDELDEWATRVAARLRTLGVTPETRVGIAIERSIEGLVAMLAVLKAGGAYVPMDPTWPDARRASLVRESGVRLVLTSAGTQPLFDIDGVPTLTVVDAFADTESIGGRTPATTAALAAYVIYTSGSSGRPKGVTIEHRSLVNYVRTARALFDLRPGDRVLQFAPWTFDTSVEEIFTTLTSGATLVLRTDDMTDTIATCLAGCEQQRITVLDLPTAYWQLLTAALDADGLRLPASVRLVIIGGEAATAAALDQWRRCVPPHVRLINTYGPTEATIVATTSELSASPDLTRSGPPPIGRAIAGVHAMVLDARLRPTPHGVPGELCIGGLGLARGYLNHASLTAERFVPDPSSTMPGVRMYRTGDLVRWLPNGELEYLRRTDRQVKTRGFRIEPGEIEAALAAHPDVSHAFVMMCDAFRMPRQLVAFVVPRVRSGSDVQVLRTFLRERLPAFLMPAQIVLLDALPLTAHGKVDVRALDSLAAAAREAREPTAPRSPIEELIAGIWIELLGVATVDVHDNFFDLGGHSLLAAQILSRIRQACRVDLSLRTLFESPTIAGLAETIDARLRDAGGTSPAIIPAATRGEPAPLSFDQERLWLMDHALPDTHFFNMPVAVRIEGPLDAALLERSLFALVQRHAVLRTTFDFGDTQLRQIVHATSPLTLRVVDLTALPDAARDDQLAAIAREEHRQPFDLAHGPLLRVALVRLAADDQVFVLTMHHIISDGWSIGVFLKELATLYEAEATGNEARLPALTIQYADFARWQRQQAEQPAFEAQAASWLRRMIGGEPAPDLFASWRRTTDRSFTMSRHTASWPDDLVDRVRHMARRMGATPFMVVLAAYKMVLKSYSGEDDIRVAALVANRKRHELEHLIGLFVNTVILRTDLAGDLTLRDALTRVRATTLDAFAHEDVPFELLARAVEASNGKRRSLAQALFLWQHDERREVQRGPLTFRSMPLSTHGADGDIVATTFDLILETVERGRGLDVSLKVNADIVSDDEAKRMLADVRAALEAAVA